MLYYLGFGSNIGDREGWLASVCDALRAHGEVKRVSSPFYNAAHVLPGQNPHDHPEYLNVVIEFASTLAPEELLATLQEIERCMGRDRTREGRWGDRTVDLDVIAAECGVWNSETLTVPHLRMHQRDFVLIPLQELNPHWMHPILQQSIGMLVAKLRA